MFFRRFLYILIVLTLMISLAGGASPLWAYDLTVEEEEFIDTMEHDMFRYFVEETNPYNGLIKDSSRPGAPCSIASVGFGLVALCIGDYRGWIETDKAYERILQILTTFNEDVDSHKGFYYHFVDMRNGKRVWNSELSSIDTGLFLAGALFAASYFPGTEVEYLAYEIYKKADWKWMLNNRDLLCMGWTPESGFLPYYWDTYNEAMILYALALGSPSHTIPKRCWVMWDRPVTNYKGMDIIYCDTGSLFVYLESHAWIDFRKVNDDGIDYWANTVNAIKANQLFCWENRESYPTYYQEGWGLTASLGPRGYKGYGAKPGWPIHDGTVAPFVVAATMPFTPEQSIETLRYIYNRYGNKVYGKYGFKDAYNVGEDWWADEYLGIDVGLALLMTENFRSGMVWDYFMSIPPVKRWQRQCFR